MLSNGIIQCLRLGGDVIDMSDCDSNGPLRLKKPEYARSQLLSMTYKPRESILRIRKAIEDMLNKKPMVLVFDGRNGSVKSMITQYFDKVGI